MHYWAEQAALKPPIRTVIALLAALMFTLTTFAESPTLQSVKSLIDQDRLTEAAASVIQLDDQAINQKTEGARPVVPLIQLARKTEQTGKHQLASELYNRAIAAMDGTHESLSETQAVIVHLAAAGTFKRVGKNAQSLKALKVVVAKHHMLNDAQVNAAAQMLVQLGSELLSAEEPSAAEAAYALAQKLGIKPFSTTALLGRGWAQALQPEGRVQAAQTLSRFYQEFPDHPDAPQAAALCMSCWQESDKPAKATAVVDKIVTQWPDSEVATKAVSWIVANKPNQLSDSAKAWLSNQTSESQIQRLDAMLCREALLIAVSADESKRVGQLADQLAVVDQTGQTVADILQRLSSTDQHNFAESLASGWMTTTHQSAIAVREATCRWAGRQQKWSLIAEAAAESELDEPTQTRTVAVVRLFAESLMQTGQPSAAKPWWDHLVDVRNVDDFATLLRCAETAATFDEFPTAKERIEKALLAAGDNAGRQSLVRMLSAELAIRQLKFDDARALLEQVIRSSGSIAQLKGRAQWLIGETYYLQQKFSQAIEAYRKVEGIDPNGVWIAVSLVQAGKSFEQLGRTREAVVCYSSLIGRFPDSPHASAAHKRLAAIGPDSNSNQKNIRR